jgi:hypothetical protein
MVKDDVEDIDIAKMSMDDFLKMCEEEDFNIVNKWDKEHFIVVCNKCKSEDVLIFFREESGAMGSEYTGYMRAFNCDNGMIVKCKSCGNAMDIRLPMGH